MLLNENSRLVYIYLSLWVIQSCCMLSPTQIRLCWRWTQLLGKGSLFCWANIWCGCTNVAASPSQHILQVSNNFLLAFLEQKSKVEVYNVLCSWFASVYFTLWTLSSKTHFLVLPLPIAAAVAQWLEQSFSKERDGDLTPPVFCYICLNIQLY